MPGKDDFAAAVRSFEEKHRAHREAVEQYEAQRAREKAQGEQEAAARLQANQTKVHAAIRRAATVFRQADQVCSGGELKPRVDQEQLAREMKVEPERVVRFILRGVAASADAILTVAGTYDASSATLRIDRVYPGGAKEQQTVNADELTDEFLWAEAKRFMDEVPIL